MCARTGKRERRSLLKERTLATYVDIGISIILLLAILIGALRGFAKQFTGGFCGIIGLIGSIGLTILILPALHRAGLLKSFAATATGWFKGETFTAELSDMEQLNEALSAGFLRILSKLSPRIWSSMEANGMNTLGAYFGDLCARFIVGTIIWIVLILIFKLIFWGIRRLLKKLASLPVLHTLDKIFGAIWSFAFTYIIVICILLTGAEIVVVKWLPNVRDTLWGIISETKVFQFLHETNIFGSYVAQLLNVDLSTLMPIV